MLKKQLKTTLLLCLTAIFSCQMGLYAQDIPSPMSPPRLVNDFVSLFSDNQRQELESMLRAYNDSTSTQIYVVTVSDLQGYDAATFATSIGNKWGVGQKGKNNGAVVLIKPKTADGRGALYIATGYGLEEKLTDARCGRIMDKQMIPAFRNGDYFVGTKAGIEAMQAYLAGQFEADETEDETDLSGIFTLLIIGIIILYITTRKHNGNGNGNNSHGSGGGTFFPPFFPPIFRGGNGSGGSFGGGFGGSGGGSFGGGGAGRSW